MVTIAPFRQDQYAATDETRCVSVFIPDDDSYLALLAGLLALASRTENYEDPESAQAEGVAATWQDAYVETDWSPCLTSQWLISDVRVFVDQWRTLSGSSIAWLDVANQPYGGVWRQTPAAINDQVNFEVALKAGQYTVTVNGVSANNRGIQTLYLDGDLIATIDWYSAATVVDVTGGGTFTLPADGVYTLNSKVLSKNASSSSYVLQWVYINFRRTADV